MKVPLNRTESKLIVKRSLFLSFCYPFSDLKLVKDFLKKDSLQYHQATHYVYAFRIGDNKEFQEGFTDDGEPKGTAGRPMLSLLRNKNYSNILVIVVRFFGGIKLGVGGLVRAYSDSAQLALEKVHWKTFEVTMSITLILPYSLYNLVIRELSLFGAVLINENFSDKIQITLEIAQLKKEAFLKRLSEMSSKIGTQIDANLYDFS